MFPYYAMKCSKDRQYLENEKLLLILVLLLVIFFKFFVVSNVFGTEMFTKSHMIISQEALQQIGGVFAN